MRGLLSVMYMVVYVYNLTRLPVNEGNERKGTRVCMCECTPPFLVRVSNLHVTLAILCPPPSPVQGCFTASYRTL